MASACTCASRLEKDNYVEFGCAVPLPCAPKSDEAKIISTKIRGFYIGKQLFVKYGERVVDPVCPPTLVG